MTEAEWLRCADPQPMLAFIQGKVSARKLRLFAVACCRRLLDLLTHEDSLLAVSVAERFADGKASTEELRLAEEMAMWAADDATWSSLGPATWAAFAAASVANKSERVALGITKEVVAVYDGRPQQQVMEQTIQAELACCIFGNPFHPVVADPAWLTSTVVQLASGISEDRAFDRLPILADALQDAGCYNEDVLNHLRESCLHVKGCWALDLVLGKS